MPSVGTVFWPYGFGVRLPLRPSSASTPIPRGLWYLMSFDMEDCTAAGPQWSYRDVRVINVRSIGAPERREIDRGLAILAAKLEAEDEHARAVVEGRRMGQVVKTKEGNVVNNPHLGIANRQAFIMIRAAGELGFTPSARASLGMIDESRRGGPRLIGEVNPFDEFR
jgi:hypothetical protein